MAAHMWTPSTVELKRPKYVQFGILGPEEITDMSVAKIDNPITWDKGTPKEGGLFDPRMGTVDRMVKCTSCLGKINECPARTAGHFGHIELAKPVYHQGFLPSIVKVLRAVCYNCSKLLMDTRNPRLREALRVKNPRARLRAVSNQCRTRTRCEGGQDIDGGEKKGKDTDQEMNEFGNKENDNDADTTAKGGGNEKKGHGGCGHNQPRYSSKGVAVFVEWAQPGGVKKKEQLMPSQAHDILKNISDEECEMLGFDPKWARPDWMILTVFPVPPPAVRPSVMMDSTARSEDDLSHKLADILKHNRELRRQEAAGAPAHIIQDFATLLQYHTATYMMNDNIDPVATQKSGRPIKAINARLRGKEGRVRGNLMGKRVDFSARTVITGDPNLGIDQIGVPRGIALNLTYPEIVTAENIDEMAKLVMNGPLEHPGAKHVIRDDGTRIDLRFNRDIPLQPGYRVERHICDGDVIVFNRQPTLHKMSMMGHRVKVMPYSTFRMNLSVTTPYNADFDGDEMNLHVPQTPQTRAEVTELMMVQKMIVSPQSNRPVIGIVQDTLLGASKFTKRDVFLEKDFALNLLMWLPNWDGRIPQPAILKPRPLWTGKQIFSLILPAVNLLRFHSTHPDKERTPMSPGDTRVIIRHGEVISGILCKSTLGTKERSLVHTIWLEYGPEHARAFLNNAQLIVNYWLLHNGFSIGIGDTIADASTMGNIQTTLKGAREEVKNLVIQAQGGELKCQPGKTIEETFEMEVNRVLNTARDDSGRRAHKSLSDMNNFRQMVAGGSKGSFINIAQKSLGTLGFKQTAPNMRWPTLAEVREMRKERDSGSGLPFRPPVGVLEVDGLLDEMKESDEHIQSAERIVAMWMDRLERRAEIRSGVKHESILDDTEGVFTTS